MNPLYFAPGVAVRVTMEIISMFGNSSDRQSYLKRVASHSTKGHANGRIDVLPPCAREREQVYVSTKEQWENIEAVALRLKSEMNDILAAKGDTRRVNDIQKQLHALADTRARLAETARAVGYEAYGWAFMCVAELRLSKEMFRMIDEEVELLIGRRRSEVKLPTGFLVRLKKKKAAEKSLIGRRAAVHV